MSANYTGLLTPIPLRSLMALFTLPMILLGCGRISAGGCGGDSRCTPIPGYTSSKRALSADLRFSQAGGDTPIPTTPLLYLPESSAERCSSSYAPVTHGFTIDQSLKENSPPSDVCTAGEATSVPSGGEIARRLSVNSHLWQDSHTPVDTRLADGQTGEVGKVFQVQYTVAASESEFYSGEAVTLRATGGTVRVTGIGDERYRITLENVVLVQEPDDVPSTNASPIPLPTPAPGAIASVVVNGEIIARNEP